MARTENEWDAKNAGTKNAGLQNAGPHNVTLNWSRKRDCRNVKPNELRHVSLIVTVDKSNRLSAVTNAALNAWTTGDEPTAYADHCCEVRMHVLWCRVTQESSMCHADIDASEHHVRKNFTHRYMDVRWDVSNSKHHHVAAAALNSYPAALTSVFCIQSLYFWRYVFIKMCDLMGLCASKYWFPQQLQRTLDTFIITFSGNARTMPHFSSVLFSPLFLVLHFLPLNFCLFRIFYYRIFSQPKMNRF